MELLGVPIRQWSVARDGKITEPGLYDIPMHDYHSDCCDGPSISSGGLRKIWNWSPAHYWDTSYLNPDRDTSDDSGAADEAKGRRLGRAVHTLLLDPAEFERSFTTRPGAFDSWRTKAAREWRAEHVLAGYTVLEPAEMLLVKGMTEALRGHAIHRDGILDGAIELSMIWKDAKTGVWLKSRPDAIPISAPMFGDIKCVADARRLAVQRSMNEYAYDMQMALGSIGYETVIGREIEDFVLIFVESKRPFAVAVRPIDGERIKWAKLKLRHSIDTFARCWEEGRWPSYDADDGEKIMLSGEERTRLTILRDSGLLPKEW